MGGMSGLTQRAGTARLLDGDDKHIERRHTRIKKTLIEKE